MELYLLLAHFCLGFPHEGGIALFLVSLFYSYMEDGARVFGVHLLYGGGLAHFGLVFWYEDLTI